jgi:hypothetical protein
MLPTISQQAWRSIRLRKGGDTTGKDIGLIGAEKPTRQCSAWEKGGADVFDYDLEHIVSYTATLDPKVIVLSPKVSEPTSTVGPRKFTRKSR